MTNRTICVVGLGYVGLPLAHAFALKGYTVYGYDVSSERIQTLKEGYDWTRELSKEDLKSVQMEFSNTPDVIANADIVIMALPTPVDENKKPDITILKDATATVGKHLKPGAIVVFESTVYPGTTEEICGPILEKESGMKSGSDFFLGYSPERINPGDKEHTVFKIVKVVAGQDEKTTDVLCDLYKSIIEAGVHRAPNIKTAEMAKAIENAQRDLNIAFVNEVAQLCHKIDIDTSDVLDAAGTKWNFLPFKPGLVGGHCIGVDPYYLVEKAEQLGMKTHVISAGRAVNDAMSTLVADETIEKLTVDPKDARVLVLGLTFKENIPDTRNSKSFDVIAALKAKGCDVYVDDPHVEETIWKKIDAKRATLNDGPFDAILLLVPHAEYAKLNAETLKNALTEDGVFYDIKGVFDRKYFENRSYISL